MAKSIIISKHGGPEVLELKDVNVGSPAPEEIKIKNLAIGLNFIDTYHRSGLYKLKLPSGIGMEGAGIVQEVRDRQYYEKPNQKKHSKNQEIKRRRTIEQKKAQQKGYRHPLFR